MLNALVINLKRRPDRLEQFLRWNTRPGISFELVEAVDGRQIERDRLVDQGLLTPETGNWSDGAIGHALTSRLIFERCEAKDGPLLVLEDDICLRGDFIDRVTPIMTSVKRLPDIIYCGYNTDAGLCFQGPEGLLNMVFFEESCKSQPGYFERFAELRPPQPPNLLRSRQVWGTPAYIITSEGARRLLQECFPLRSSPPLPLPGQRRSISPYSIDALINHANLLDRINAFCFIPPLALGPNDHRSSDVVKAMKP